jgi:hypothetical protein
MSVGRDFRDLAGADPWKLLGVARDADADEIRRSYRRLSRSHHTDVGGDADQQARINRAYAVLSDPTRRADYAQLLDRPKQQPTANPTGFAEPDPNDPPADPFEWSTGPAPSNTQPYAPPRQPSPPPRQPYTSRREPYVAPPYQQTPQQDPYVAPPYRDPYSAPSYPTQRRGLSGRAVAALITVVICSPLSVILAIQALRTMRWSGQRGKTLAWLALAFDALFIGSFVYTQLK